MSSNPCERGALAPDPGREAHRRPSEECEIEMRRLLLLCGVLAGFFDGAVPAQANIETEGPPELVTRLIAGRLYVKGHVKAHGQSVAAHFLVELGHSAFLRLHVNTARLVKWQPGDVVDVTFPEHEIKGIDPNVARLRFLEYLTMEYAKELEEIPVVGILGAPAWGRHRLQIDYEKSRFRLLPRKVVKPTEDTEPPKPAEEGAPPAEAPAKEGKKPPPGVPVGETVTIPMRLRDGSFRFRVRVNDQRELLCAIATAEADTWIDQDLAASLGHPAGDVESARLGEVDLAKYVALRPGEAPRSFDDQPDVLLGNNFLSNFDVVLDPFRSVMELTAYRPAKFPKEDQQVFRALALEDPDGLVEFLKKHVSHRMARDAGQALLKMRLADDPLDESELNEAVTLRAKSTPAKRRSRVMLDLVKRTREENPSAFAMLRKTALDEALAGADKDEDADSVHKTRSEIGGLLMEEGELKKAYRHLLSAAFGLPRDGMVNLRLGKFFEKKGKHARAWSRFLMAAITKDAGPDGMKGLKRLADTMGVTTPYDVDEMERALEGRVPAFEPASTYRPKGKKKPSRVVLAELFTGAHCRPCLAADLGFDGIMAHFRKGEVVLIEHHLPVPAPEPLVSPAALERAQEVEVRGTPAAFVDGLIDVPRLGGARVEKAGPAFRALRKTIEKRLESETPWKLSVSGKLSDDKSGVSVAVEVDGPARSGVMMRAYLCERTVLFPGSSKIVLHRYVTRDELTGGGKRVAKDAGKRSFALSAAFAKVTSKLETQLDDFENRTGKEFPMRPTKIDPRQVVVVAFLESTTGDVLQAASWEAFPRERE